MNSANPRHPPRQATPAAAPLVDVSVVIPVYNERHRLAATLAEVCAHLRARGGGWEVIVVDDGSADDSAEIAARFAATEPGVRPLLGARNRGKGHAVRRGVLASRGRRVLYCDADLATPIAELDRLDAELDAGAVAAIGSRSGPRARIAVRQPLARVLLGRLGNRLIRAAAVAGVRDTQCGFKLFDGDAARRLFPLVRTEGWGFDVEVLHLLVRNGWPVAEVPVRWSHRPGSKVRPRDYPATLAELVRIRLRHRGTLRLPEPTVPGRRVIPVPAPRRAEPTVPSPQAVAASVTRRAAGTSELAPASRPSRAVEPRLRAAAPSPPRGGRT